MNCSFGTCLAEALGDQLVVGLRSRAIRCGILAAKVDKGLILDNACVIAASMEVAENQAREHVIEATAQ
ncbi:hypothetical protein HPB50_029398 [Hyalomma asiaticum]|nr:hypothetical protein HPB50_029398 [Hyalomma asiaticum]